MVIHYSALSPPEDSPPPELLPPDSLPPPELLPPEPLPPDSLPPPDPLPELPLPELLPDELLPELLPLLEELPLPELPLEDVVELSEDFFDVLFVVLGVPSTVLSSEVPDFPTSVDFFLIPASIFFTTSEGVYPSSPKKN